MEMYAFNVESNFNKGGVSANHTEQNGFCLSIQYDYDILNLEFRLFSTEKAYSFIRRRCE